MTKSHLARMGVALIVSAVFPLTGRATNITRIGVDFESPTSPPATFTFLPGDGGPDDGILNVDIDDFSLIVTRDRGMGPVSETIANASFTLTATGLSDMSSGSSALGRFDLLTFEISSAGDILLSGETTVSNSSVYEESSLVDTMFLFADPLAITGGNLADEFAAPATLAGIVTQISPTTASFSRLDTDHTGSVILEFTPVPEPMTLVLLLIGVLLVAKRAKRELTASV